MRIAQPFEGKQVFAGLDLSSTTDLTALSLVERRQDGGWNCNWTFWIPETRVEKAERDDLVPYGRWIDEGWIKTTPKSRIHHGTVKRDTVEACLDHDVRVIGFDPWNAEWLQSELEHEGFDLIRVRQGYPDMSEPSKHFEASIADGTLRHGGNPVLRWMVENVEVMTDHNANIRPVKPEHGSSKRVDGVVATIIAIAVALETPNNEEEWSEETMFL